MTPAGRRRARVLLLAPALALALALALAGPGVDAIAAPWPGGPPEALRFAALPWNASADDVARRLAAAGFARRSSGEHGEPGWEGVAFARRARLEPEYDAHERLIAVTLRFAPDSRGSAVQRYGRLVEQVRRRHGAWEVQLGPGRAVTETRVGRLAVVRGLGERVAVTLWTDAGGAAAAVQLARDDVLWLRYEAPGWEERSATASP